jgi:general stress protein 26
METKHNTAEIVSYLLRNKVGVLGTFDKDNERIRMRVMYYGVDINFNCYLMSARDCPKMEQILKFPQLTLMVYGLEVPFDDSWEAEIEGTPVILTEKADIDYALERLKNRNPFADVALEAGLNSQFHLIKLVPQTVRFSIYKESLEKIPSTVITL